MNIQFDIKRDGSRGFIVSRVGGTYEQHAHISTKNGARYLIRFIHNNIEPRNEYLQGSCRRLLTDLEYSRLKRPKQRYVNRR